MLKQLAATKHRRTRTSGPPRLPSAPQTSPAGDGPMPMNKWALTGLGLILTIALLGSVWWAHAGSGAPADTRAVAAEGSHAGRTVDWRDRQAIDAELYFERRARATEEGFFAAFPFHR